MPQNDDLRQGPLFLAIAFLDIEMGELTGIDLAQKCKDLCGQVNIIFVTGYSQYTMDALKLHANGYLMKPVRQEELREVLIYRSKVTQPFGAAMK